MRVLLYYKKFRPQLATAKLVNNIKMLKNIILHAQYKALDLNEG